MVFLKYGTYINVIIHLYINYKRTYILSFYKMHIELFIIR